MFKNLGRAAHLRPRTWPWRHPSGQTRWAPVATQSDTQVLVCSASSQHRSCDPRSFVTSSNTHHGLGNSTHHDTPTTCEAACAVPSNRIVCVCVCVWLFVLLVMHCMYILMGPACAQRYWSETIWHLLAKKRPALLHRTVAKRPSAIPRALTDPVVITCARGEWRVTRRGSDGAAALRPSGLRWPVR